MRRAGLDGAMLVVWLGAVPVATPAFAASGKAEQKERPHAYA